MVRGQALPTSSKAGLWETGVGTQGCAECSRQHSVPSWQDDQDPPPQKQEGQLPESSGKFLCSLSEGARWLWPEVGLGNQSP